VVEQRKAARAGGKAQRIRRERGEARRAAASGRFFHPAPLVTSLSSTHSSAPALQCLYRSLPLLRLLCSDTGAACLCDSMQRRRTSLVFPRTLPSRKRGRVMRRSLCA
jgi:hypothetical protein